MPEGVKLHKWPYKNPPTEEAVADEMKKYGYTVYDLQTIPPGSNAVVTRTTMTKFAAPPTALPPSTSTTVR